MRPLCLWVIAACFAVLFFNLSATAQSISQQPDVQAAASPITDQGAQKMIPVIEWWRLVSWLVLLIGAVVSAILWSRGERRYFIAVLEAAVILGAIFDLIAVLQPTAPSLASPSLPSLQNPISIPYSNTPALATQNLAISGLQYGMAIVPLCLGCLTLPVVAASIFTNGPITFVAPFIIGSFFMLGAKNLVSLFNAFPQTAPNVTLIAFSTPGDPSEGNAPAGEQETVNNLTMAGNLASTQGNGSGGSGGVGNSPQNPSGLPGYSDGNMLTQSFPYQATDQSQLASLLGPNGQSLAGAFIAAGQQYNISPALLAAMASEETGNFTSSAFLNNNNAMGVSNNSGPISFASAQDSINYMAAVMARSGGTYSSVTSISQLGAIYSPPGASNDPNGTNGTWPSEVQSFYNKYSSALYGSGH